jgi:hypothetical protein
MEESELTPCGHPTLRVTRKWVRTCEAVIPEFDVRLVVAALEVPPPRVLRVVERLLAILACELGFPHCEMMGAKWLRRDPIKYEMDTNRKVFDVVFDKHLTC